MRKIFIVLAVLTVLIGCNRSFSRFPLRVESEAGSQDVVLRERPGGLRVGRAHEDEGTLTGSDDLLVLSPVSRIDVPPQASLIVRLSQPAAGLSVIVRDDEEIVARATISGAYPSGARDHDIAVAVPLPDNATIDRVEFTLSETPAVPVRVLGLSTATAPVGVGEYGADASLYASPGAAVETWGRTDTRSTWTVDRRAAYGWGADEPVEIRYRYGGSTDEGPGTAQLTVGAARFEVDLRPGSNRVILYPEVEGVSVDRLVVDSADPDLEVEWIGPLAGDFASLPVAMPVDIGTLYRYEPGLWRQSDFELFSWTLYPEVLILDSADYDVQARFFRRLAFYVEKTGFRGTLLTDEQLRGRHGYNAHNYNADGLARFYNEVEATGIAINDEEVLLREMLLENGVLRRSGDGFAPGSGGILAVSQESRMIPTLRDLLLSHEAYHGVYYSEPEYVRQIDALWDSLDDEQQRYWRLLLGGLQYDVGDGYLLRNEYHAYLLQQPVASANWYFETRSAERIARWYPASAAWLQSYLGRYRGTHREQAATAEAILSSLTGLAARDVACLEPVDFR